MDINFVKKAILIELKIYIATIADDIINNCDKSSDEQDRRHDYLRDATEWTVSVDAVTSADNLLALIRNNKNFHWWLTDVVTQPSERQTLIKTVLVFAGSPAIDCPVQVIE